MLLPKQPVIGAVLMKIMKTGQPLEPVSFSKVIKTDTAAFFRVAIVKSL
jgi:hypothetical protein